MPEEARLGCGCTSDQQRGDVLGVYPVRCSGGQLLDTWLCEGKSGRWLSPVTCGSLGMVYTAKLDSSQQTF